MKNRILTGKYWDWASENRNRVKACKICDPTKLVWDSSEHFGRFYGNFIILAYSRNSADKRKITKMTIESWKMVEFHFLKKENKVQLEPDRMSYSYLGVNWIFGGQKLTFVSNSSFRDRAQTLTLTLHISRMRIFLAKRRWLTSYLTRITHLRKFEWNLTEGKWVRAF